MKTTLIYLVLGAIMGIGGMAMLQASIGKQDDHCVLVKAQVLTESEELLAQGKFPSQDQLDYWKQITKDCNE